MLWFDPRIIVELDEIAEEEHILLYRDQRDKIWFPDPYLISSIDVNVPRLLLDPHALVIYKNGTVEFHIREEIQAVCPMNFINYPVSTAAQNYI